MDGKTRNPNSKNRSLGCLFFSEAFTASPFGFFFFTPPVAGGSALRL